MKSMPLFEPVDEIQKFHSKKHRLLCDEIIFINNANDPVNYVSATNKF